MTSNPIIVALVSITLMATAIAQGNRTSFDLSKIDEGVVGEFKKAWKVSGNGKWKVEGVVLIFRNTDGSYKAVSQGCTNQSRKFTFKWGPKAIAIVHTHPTDRSPKPHEPDKELADRLGVPMFTIASRGMYMYDPATKKISKVMDGMDWLDLSKWEEKAAPVLRDQHN